MIRKLLATTAIATLMATGGVMAQTDTTTGTGTSGATTQAAPPAQPMEKKAEGDLATNLIGKTVYNGTGDDAENIGEVNDLVLDKDGTVKAIVVGVGGFLGIGEKEVALEYNLVDRAQKDDDEWLVVETTADALKAQEEFDRDAYEPMPADADVSETKPATKEDLDNAPTEDSADQADTDGGDAATGGMSDDDAMSGDDSSATGGADAGSDDAGGSMQSDDGAASDTGSDSGAATEGSDSSSDSMQSDDGAASDTGSDSGASTDDSGSSGDSMNSDEEKPADDSSSQ